jgi:hypothetical protein
MMDRYWEWQGYQERPRRMSARQEACQPSRHNYWVLPMTVAELARIDDLFWPGP